MFLGQRIKKEIIVLIHLIGAAPWGIPGMQQAGVDYKGLPIPLDVTSRMYLGGQAVNAETEEVEGLPTSSEGVPVGFQHRQMGDMMNQRANMDMRTMPIGSGIQYETGNFGDILRTMNAERMQLEDELREEEDSAMKEFTEAKVCLLFHSMCNIKNTILELKQGAATETSKLLLFLQ